MREKINMILKFKKYLFIVLILAIFTVAPNFTQAQSAATKKAAAKSWSAFWTKFSSAVKNKDRKTFIKLTRTSFWDAGGFNLEEWLDNTSWRRLRNSVNRGTMNHGEGKDIARITKNRDLIFVYDRKKGWRFYGELVT